MLTRESIRSGAVRRIAAEQGLMRVLSDEELAASLGGLLDGVDLATGVWVFAYGSLIWNPAFHFTGRVVGRIFGFHRRFCLWTHLGRGCPERPGLTLGLERGGCCRGPRQRACVGVHAEQRGRDQVAAAAERVARDLPGLALGAAVARLDRRLGAGATKEE